MQYGGRQTHDSGSEPLHITRLATSHTLGSSLSFDAPAKITFTIAVVLSRSQILRLRFQKRTFDSYAAVFVPERLGADFPDLRSGGAKLGFGETDSIRHVRFA